MYYLLNILLKWHFFHLALNTKYPSYDGYRVCIYSDMTPRSEQLLALFYLKAAEELAIQAPQCRR